MAEYFMKDMLTPYAVDNQDQPVFSLMYSLYYEIPL